VKNWGRNGWILNANKLDLTIWVPDYGAKFHQNRATIATVGDAGEFIICPVLCYSNVTDLPHQHPWQTVVQV